MTIKSIPRPPVKEIRKSKSQSVPSSVPSVDESPPTENDQNDVEDEDFNTEEGILNAREPSKEADETYEYPENPERILR